MDLPPKKKVKFAQQETEEPSFFEGNDEVDFGLEAKKRKGQVNLEGIDSEDEEEGERRLEDSDEEDNPRVKRDEDEDMLQEEDKKEAESGLFGGQIRDPDAAEYTEDGVKITPFNMDQELEEGEFDESGHYIQNKDEEAMHDTWLQGVSRTDIAKAGISHTLREARRKAFDELGTQKSHTKPAIVLLKILRMMKPRETVLATLRRLGSLAPKKIPVWKQKMMEKKGKKATTGHEVEENADPDAVEKLTAYADTAMAQGNLGKSCEARLMIKDIYEMTYEQIVRQLRISEILEDTWMPGDVLPSVPEETDIINDKLWEYKWSTDTAEVQGPFTTTKMREWMAQGYFTPDLAVRQVTQSTPLDAISGFVPISTLNELQ